MQYLILCRLQYLEGIQGPVDVLVCGWAGEVQMGALLAELDHGPNALHPGSTVTLLNDCADCESLLGKSCRPLWLTGRAEACCARGHQLGGRRGWAPMGHQLGGRRGADAQVGTGRAYTCAA